MKTVKTKIPILLFFALIALIPLLTACVTDSPQPTRSLSDDTAHSDISTVSGVSTSDGEMTGKRYALVIGNANYVGKVLSLKNPTNDAYDMENTLESLDFDVMSLKNATSGETMREAVRAFTKKLHPGSVGLFYYAGHAIQVDGENYLIPTQADLLSETKVESETMSANYVLDQMKVAGNGSNIIILDACRDNPFAKSASLSKDSSRGVERTGELAKMSPDRGIKRIGGLAKMRNPEGSIIAFATSPNKTALDGTGRNGTYTKHLLRTLKIPGLTIEAMFKQVRVAVWDETNGRQVPWENSSFRGEFCFSGCKTPESEEAEKQLEEAKKRAEDAERKLAIAIKEAEDAENRAKASDANSSQTLDEAARIKAKEAKLLAKEAKLLAKEAQLRTIEAKQLAREAELRAIQAARAEKIQVPIYY